MFGKRTKIKELLATPPQGQEVTVMGWVRTFRNNQFIALNDGSTNSNLQVVIELGMLDEETQKRMTASASLKVTGTLIASLGRGQTVEVKAATVEILGDSDAAKYPLQLKNKPTLEYLREIAHLRFRTNTFGAVFRIRHALAFAVHRFFNERGFVYLHTPIITASDAEGAGEMFRVSTLSLKNTPFISKRFTDIAAQYYNNLILHIEKKDLSRKVEGIDSMLKSIDTKTLSFKSLITDDPISLKSTLINKDFTRRLGKKMIDLFHDLISTGFFTRNINYLNKEKIQLPEWLIESVNPARKGISAKLKVYKANYLILNFYNYSFINNQLRNSSDREVNFKEDFFGRATNLTVSGQLEGELGATAFGEIYTFGPTFRAENSNTARHLAEFWMIEPEMAFFDLEDNAALAEEFIQYIIRYAMEHNADDIEALRQRLLDEEKGKPQPERSELDLLQKLQFVTENRFERVTYTEAISILLQSSHYKKGKFQYDVSWGIDMQSEHERYLVEKHFRKPVIVTGYPKEIKAFYMRQNDDGKTVAAMDILAPGIGEIVGGSQREERLDKLETRMKEMGIPVEEMWWYLDTRRFGTVPHAGFGLGFERMVQFVTGMGNIRDVIPFPRTPKSAEF